MEKISIAWKNCSLEQLFAQKDNKFWEDGIMKFPEKWQKVMEQEGEYVVQ